MANEKYVGIKFEVNYFFQKILQDEKIKDLIHWCNVFDKQGFTPSYGKGNSGNLSFRTEKGFIITCTGCFYNQMDYKNFCEVLSVDFANHVVNVIGTADPSSETFLHYLIYKKRKDINAVFHGHFNLFFGLKNVPITDKEMPYGTIELAHEVEKIADRSDFLMIKNHGFVSLGKTMEQAGELALSMKYKIFI
jgi:ribulose-5-phosphate 4-epimerase/fuculose-1-phosphate aldolase